MNISVLEFLVLLLKLKAELCISIFKMKVCGQLEKCVRFCVTTGKIVEKRTNQTIHNHKFVKISYDTKFE